MSHSHRHRAKGAERRKYFAPSAQAVYVCTCGKYAYGSKKAAKAVIERAHRGEAMNVYRCKQSNAFHCGHLSPRIKAGYTTRIERYG